MTQAKWTPGKWELEIGEDRCFHNGNRVAITVSGEEDGEPYNVTIAELWPADNERDIHDGRLIAAAPELAGAHDPDTLEAIAVEIDCFKHSARAASLRKLAKDARAALKAAGVGD